MSLKHGVTTFHYKYFNEREKVITSSWWYGTDESYVDKEVKETDCQLWKRIDDFVNENQVVVINIETITRSSFCTGGRPERVYICNQDADFTYAWNNIIGYRVFYRK